MKVSVVYGPPLLNTPPEFGMGPSFSYQIDAGITYHSYSDELADLVNNYPIEEVDELQATPEKPLFFMGFRLLL